MADADAGAGTYFGCRPAAPSMQTTSPLAYELVKGRNGCGVCRPTTGTGTTPCGEATSYNSACFCSQGGQQEQAPLRLARKAQVPAAAFR